MSHYSLLSSLFPSICLSACLTLEEFVCREQRWVHIGQLSQPSSVAGVLHCIALCRKMLVQVI